MLFVSRDKNINSVIYNSELFKWEETKTKTLNLDRKLEFTIQVMRQFICDFSMKAKGWRWR